MNNPEIGPKVLASGLIIKFIYHNPEAVIIVHCPIVRLFRETERILNLML